MIQVIAKLFILGFKMYCICLNT